MCEEDTAEIVLARLKLSRTLEENTESTLISLLVHCRKKGSAGFCSEAVRCGLHKYVLDCVIEVPATSESVSC